MSDGHDRIKASRHTLEPDRWTTCLIKLRILLEPGHNRKLLIGIFSRLNAEIQRDMAGDFSTIQADMEDLLAAASTSTFRTTQDGTRVSCGD